MRHGKKFNHLGRKAAHRNAMLMNMANSLILHKRIHTTVAKAKALRVFVEPILTKAKSDNTHSRRMVFSYLRDKHAVAELFREVGVKIANRPGGYTRIIKLGARQGDNAEMALIELVDFNENLLTEKKAKSSTRKRTRRAGKAATAGTEEAKAQEEAPKKEAKAPKAKAKAEEADTTKEADAPATDDAADQAEDKA